MFQKMMTVILCAALTAGLLASVQAQSTVKIIGKNGSFSLEVGGKPFFIRGVGGVENLELLTECGGNAVRTWGIESAKRDLDRAQKYGLKVALGYWMGHERHGFDYSDPESVARQTKEVRETVQKFKDHPALLVWGVGNEVELLCQHEEAVWRQINALAVMIHELDPNHPVMMVVAEFSPEKIQQIERFCPDVDVLGINSYGGAASVPERYRAAGGTKPYILTEFGPAGHWESPKVVGNAAAELTSTEKARTYAETYRKAVQSERGKLCLGSFAFLWGHKVEATPTWYGMFLEDGSRLAAVEAMRSVWKTTQKPLENHAPEIEAVSVSDSKSIPEGKTISASCKASDRDGDSLKWTWVLLLEAAEASVGGDAQGLMPDFPDAIVEGQGTSSVKVRLPGSGIYRLYAYAHDGKGAAAYANTVLQGEGKAPVIVPKPLKPAAIPCAVYGEESDAHWVPSGYMGTTQAIHVDGSCSESPHSGETCMKVEFSDHSGWGGVLWQSPANDWGNAPGGLNLTEANTLVFYARGLNGGETVTFQVGGLENALFSDSFKPQKREITLKKTWTRYRIALDGLDLSCVKTGFGWAYASDGKPVVFFLDDIQFVKE